MNSTRLRKRQLRMKEIVLAKERGEITENQALEAIFKIVEKDTNDRK